MCGIFAVINDHSERAGFLAVEGLKRLEYRGYDSWGITIQKNNELKTLKQVGIISRIKSFNGFSKSRTAIAHTRWATTGKVNRINAHPHYSSDMSFALAQNGIVENFEDLKYQLIKKGHQFISETDTEVIVRLIEEELKSKRNLPDSVRSAFLKLEGRNTIIMVTKNNDEIIAARNGSPLVIGLAHDGKVFLSSDALSFSPWVKKMVVIENGQMIRIIKNKIKITEIKTNKRVFYKTEDLEIRDSEVDKKKFEHFMLKEIHETPNALEQLINQDLKNLQKLARTIKQAKNVFQIKVRRSE